MKELLLTMLESAKEIVKQNDKLFHLIFPIINGILSDPVPIQFSNDEDKLKTFFAVGVYCKQKKSTSLVLGLDACSRKVGKEDIKYFLENLITERPTLYPKRMRNNYIILQYVSFLKSHDNLTLFCQYLKKNKETLFLSPQFFECSDSIVIKMLMDGWYSQENSL